MAVPRRAVRMQKLLRHQSINQTIYNVLFFMLGRVGRLDPQQLYDVVIMAVARGFTARCPSCHPDDLRQRCVY